MRIRARVRSPLAIRRRLVRTSANVLGSGIEVRCRYENPVDTTSVLAGTARSMRGRAIPAPHSSVDRGDADQVAVGVGDHEGAAEDLVVGLRNDIDPLVDPLPEVVVDLLWPAGQGQAEFART